MIGVAIIEDSELQTATIVDLCAEDPLLKVVATARNGVDGVAAVKNAEPDVVLCDIGLPDIDGFEVVTRIMAERPTPIIVFTAALRVAGRRDAFDTLDLGAADVMEKPTAKELTDPLWRQKFQRELHVIARTPVVPHIYGRTRHRFALQSESPASTDPREKIIMSAGDTAPAAVFLMASAGGPRALQDVLRAMRPAFPLAAPTVLGLHFGDAMASSFSQFLGEQIDYPVSELRSGYMLRRGEIYLLPGGSHTRFISRGRVEIFREGLTSRFTPNFDHFLHSAAVHYGKRAIAAVLSGMGDDGARGLLALRKEGAITLAQDEATSLIYGMPKEAQDLGAAQLQLPPAEIGSLIVEALHAAKGRAALS